MGSYSRADLSLIRTFEAVASNASFSRAAQLLSLSQSTVSDHVRLLEEKVGRSLIARTTRKLVLTAAGETMLVYAQALLHVSDQIGEHFTHFTSGQKLRLGLTQDLASVRLASLLRLFRIDNPSCPILIRTTSTTELLRMLEAQELDIVLGKQPVGSTHGRTLWKSASTWIGSGALVMDRDQPVPLIVGMSGSSISRLIALEALSNASIPYDIVMEGDTLTCLQAALEAELGISIGACDHLPSFAKPINSHAILPAVADQEYFIKVRSIHLNRTIRGFAAFIEGAVTRFQTSHRHQTAGR